MRPSLALPPLSYIQAMWCFRSTHIRLLNVAVACLMIGSIGNKIWIIRLHKAKRSVVYCDAQYTHVVGVENTVRETYRLPADYEVWCQSAHTTEKWHHFIFRRRFYIWKVLLKSKKLWLTIMQYVKFCSIYLNKMWWWLYHISWLPPTLHSPAGLGTSDVSQWGIHVKHSTTNKYKI